MKDLPHGLTEPLHLLAPFPWRGWILVAVVLALAFLYWRWRRRRPAAVPSSPLPPAPVPVVAPAGILDELAELRRRHERARSYRPGCHDLSLLLRGHLERSRHRPFSRWTAREAIRAEGDSVWTRLLGLLSELQFGRRPPGRSDFSGICDLVRDALSRGSEP